MENLLRFLQKQNVLVVSTSGLKPWIFTVYFSSSEKPELFFVSRPDCNHSKIIKKNPNVAFVSYWHDPKDLGDRKGIQGTGTCHEIKKDVDLLLALRLYNKKYNGSEKNINFKSVKEKNTELKVYMIEPSYIKFWNDELYGNEGVKEFKF